MDGILLASLQVLRRDSGSTTQICEQDRPRDPDFLSSHLVITLEIGLYPIRLKFEQPGILSKIEHEQDESASSRHVGITMSPAP